MVQTPHSPRGEEPKRSSPDASEPSEVLKATPTAPNWRSHANAAANSHRRSSSGRARSSAAGNHRRQFSYPGAANRAPQQVAYPPGGYPYGMRVHGGAPQYGSMDGAEYGGYYPAAVPWLGAPWMGGYDWSGGYGMYMMNPLQACRSERSTRVVFVANVAASVDDGALQEAAAKFGDIRGYDATHRESSSGVFVSFFDVRHAEAAVKGLPEVLPGLEQNPCVAYFMMPPHGVAGMENQGTIAISDAARDVSNAEVKALFSRFGDIRSVWETNPPAPEFRFVEFFDTRCAEAALVELKAPELKGCKLQLEFAPFAGLEPVQQASLHQSYSHHAQHYPPPADQEGSPTIQNGYQSPYAAAPSHLQRGGVPHAQSQRARTRGILEGAGGGLGPTRVHGIWR